MHPFDESSLRKASSWQDFKEAQSLLNSGTNISSESTPNGWQGTVKIGSKIYRASVIVKSPKWFDAKCPCPANQGQGTFCPHAIAIGLHLLNPRKLQEPQKLSPKQELPEIAWSIQFQGPWQEIIQKGNLSLILNRSDREPTPADELITSWLISHKAPNSNPIHLSLNSQTLPSFLQSASNHPETSGSQGQISIDSGSLLHLDDCLPKNDFVLIVPSSNLPLKIENSFWNTSPNSISKIGDLPPDLNISKILTELASGNSQSIPITTFLILLSSLTSYLDFSSSPWFSSLKFASAEPIIHLSISGSDSKMFASLSTSYSQPLPSLENDLVTTQNPAVEATAISIISSLLDPLTDSSFQLTDPDRIRTFLTSQIKNLPRSWNIDLTPQLKKLSSSFISISPKITILSSTDSLVSFNLSFETQNGESVPSAEIRRLLRSKNSPQNKKISISSEIEDLIDPLFEDLDLHQENGRFIASKASANIIREIAKKFSNSDENSDFHDSPQLIHNPPVRANLRPYQIKGLSWMADCLDKYGGALLADDMGLGKTIQTIACIEHYFATYSQSSPAIVIVTTSLLGNWKNEFERFAPNRRVITLHGPKRDDLRASIQPTDVILTTYSTLARDLAWHLSQNYSIAVIDEASLIRNPDTDHSKAVAKLNASRRIALTGTPVENSARDLWAIFRFVQPGWLGTRKHFQERYEIPLKNPESHHRTATLLKIKTSPFTLRRTKSEVAPELPSKIHIDELLTMSRDQLDTYRAIQKEGQKLFLDIRSSGQNAAARMQALTTLLRLRQTCCDLALLDSDSLRDLPIPRRSAKLERLLEITEQSIAAGSRILVFSQFRKQLLEIGKALDSREIPHLRLDGQTQDRQSLVDRFQSPTGPPVFLISLKAGGYGLNLTAADVVVHFDPWWNPAAEAQATDRAHRIGQNKPVTVFRLLMRDSVEEKVVRLQSTKKALAESLDESLTPTDSTAWTSAEIEKLLLAD